MQNICQYCNKEFKNHGALLMHEKTCSKNLEAMKCPLCGRSFNSGKQLSHHKFYCSQKTLEERTSKSFNELQDDLFCQFCNKQCHSRNSLLNHERACKLNPNRVEWHLVHYNTSHPAWNKGLTADTDERVAKFTTSINKYYETHDGCWLGKTHSEESKLKIGAGVKQSLINNPDMVPYKRNHSSQESYPETYFKDLFEKENINLIYHYRINTYELDFCDVNKKIDIEIDGEQHYLDSKIIESDKRRNEFLESQGWKIIRIRWSQFKKETEECRKNEINKIKDLLK